MSTSQSTTASRSAKVSNISAAAATTSSSSSSLPCPLAELVQYDCAPKRGGYIVCSPIGRVFRMCPGRPAEEVTHHVVYDQQGRARVKEEGED